MAILDVAKLLAELSPDAPCGPDLTYDPAYLELERLAQGTPERQVGDAIIPAEEPNWRDVANAAAELLTRTRDLRIVMHATLAALQVEGLPGLRDGLALLRGVAERYWDHVYPQPDPEEPDPLERVNIIASLVDSQTFLRRLRETPLCRSVQLGRFSLRDIRVARGELAAKPSPDHPAADSGQIEAAFKDTPIEELQAEAQAVADGLADVRALDAFLTEKLGAGLARDLTPFRAMLEQVARELQENLAKRGYGAPPAPGEGAPGQAQTRGTEAPPTGQPLSGDIRSPQDVIAALDKVCRYYELNEPSSPVPLLLRRAQRLVSKSFVEIIRDLTPEAVRAIETLGGLDSGGAQR
ncbi:MAG: type VI secretion system protein TssA [Planctomycetes bacterium]|nr:type VI secretion system protein TssA [Planctomycetota bacterium]